MIIKLGVLFLAFIVAVYTLQNQFTSSPFDNFRIECAKSSGAVKINVRMVGSQGFIRQDIVFAIICERVDELYPWHGMPTGIVEMEREDCYYSHLFDPVVDTESLYTCRSREYISGITRLSDTRVQMLCCRLRTRDEANCREKVFKKPIGSDAQIEIYHRKQLINSIAVEGHNYRVRFCDLAPRSTGLIYDDTPRTTATITESLKIPKHEEHLASQTEGDLLNATSTKKTAYTKNERMASQVTTVPSPTKQVTRVFQSNSPYSSENQGTWNRSTISSVKKDHTKKIDSSLELERTSGRQLSRFIATDTEEIHRSTNLVADGIEERNATAPIVPTTSSPITQQWQSENHSTFKEDVSSSDLRYQTADTLPDFTASLLQSTASPSLILLKPLSVKALHTKVTARSKQSTMKVSTKRRTQTLSPITSTTSLKTTSQPTLVLFTEHENITRKPSVSSVQLHRDSSSGAHIDEEIKYSPFENGDNNPSRDKASESENSFSPTSSDPLGVISSLGSSFPQKISNEIRRAPIKPPRKQIGAAYSEFKGFPNRPTNKMEHEFNFPSFGDANTEDVGLDYAEYDLLMKKSADGSRTYVPENQEPLKAPSVASVYDASKQVSGNMKKKKEVQQGVQERDQEQMHDVTKELLPMNDAEVNLVSADIHTPSPVDTVLNEDLKIATTDIKQTNSDKNAEIPYDPAKFYHTPPPKRPPATEKVLTFCTKEIAIRDRHNLVIACGSETEIWQPFRCPKGSECFLSVDSSYRICCAVAESVQYAQ